MRIRVVMSAPRAVILPWNYQHYLMGAIYERLIALGPELERHFHEEGIQLGNKCYRLFTFSKLFPRYARGTDQGLYIEPPVHWYVSSPLPYLMDAFARSVLPGPTIRISRVTLEIRHAYVVPDVPPEGECMLRTISPIVTSEGVQQEDGRLWKRYLTPDEPKFWTNLAANIRNKALALGLDVGDEPVEFQPAGTWRSRLIEIQGSRVRAFEGTFIARGNNQLIRLGYQAGFGERNSQGFGMVEVAHPTPPRGRRRKRRRRMRPRR